MILKELEDGYGLGNLKTGRYNIYIIGGLGIQVNSGFKFYLEQAIGEEEVSIVESRHKVRTFIGFDKAIKFGHFSIQEPGEYSLFVEGKEHLKIKESRLIMRNLMSNTQISNDQIEICVRKNNRFW
ncbi:MAG: hypothetical protein ACJATI_005542 [Halioglobus sp.]|jgi:hypothetical protein|tara:strand:- start:299 stop:676 length:378 start_codon:yes stop_codon:yes gene_type:complete